jgi:hypothetical protein
MIGLLQVCLNIQHQPLQYRRLTHQQLVVDQFSNCLLHLSVISILLQVLNCVPDTFAG